MRRRDMLAGCVTGAMIAITARLARGSEPAHIGFVSGADQKGATDFVAALRDGLGAEGYREPDTLTLDLR